MREILLNISLVAIASALFKMLIPENSFKKQIGFLVACFFVTSVMAQITGGDFELGNLDLITFSGENESRFTDFSEQTTAYRKRIIADEMGARIREVLEQNGIEPSKIYVIVNISGLYSISINEIKLVLPYDADLVLASSLVEKEVGAGIKVTIDID